MTKGQKAHLNRIRKQLLKLVTQKYLAGQREHGGNLWQKNGMLDEAINEVIDLAVYLLTFKEQSLRRNKNKPS